jgi:hypothetical protein
MEASLDRGSAQCNTSSYLGHQKMQKLYTYGKRSAVFPLLLP